MTDPLVRDKAHGISRRWVWAVALPLNAVGLAVAVWGESMVWAVICSLFVGANIERLMCRAD